jgi:hypothetical protein
MPSKICGRSYGRGIESYKKAGRMATSGVSYVFFLRGEAKYQFGFLMLALETKSGGFEHDG